VELRRFGHAQRASGKPENLKPEEVVKFQMITEKVRSDPLIRAMSPPTMTSILKIPFTFRRFGTHRNDQK
jgi:hypothetical protein